jgi:hypothetical protein
VRSRSDLAVTYNDSAPLENFHAATCFYVMRDASRDLFAGWDPKMYQARQSTTNPCPLMPPYPPLP